MSTALKSEDLVPAAKLKLNQEEFEKCLSQFFDYWDHSGKNDFPGPEDNEQNPWHGIATFQRYFNIDADINDFHKMLENAFGKKAIDKEGDEYFRGNKYFLHRENSKSRPIANLVDLAEIDPELVKSFLKNLADESKNVLIRMEEFRQSINENRYKIPSLKGKTKLMTDTELSASDSSLLLWFLSPEKYYILESTNGQSLCELFITPLKQTNCNIGRKDPITRQFPLIQEYEMLKVLSSELKEIPSLKQELEKRNFLSEYQDPNFSCFLFYFVEFYRKFYEKGIEVPHILKRENTVNKTKIEISAQENAIVVDSKKNKIEEAEEVILVKDGAKQKYFVSRYERSPKNRKEAIEQHGTKCMACGFDFGEVYGDFGKDYIEVHHLKPLSTLDQEVEIDPKEDLVVLCSNCHRMMHHKQDRILSLDDLKKMIIANKKNPEER